MFPESPCSTFQARNLSHLYGEYCNYVVLTLGRWELALLLVNSRILKHIAHNFLRNNLLHKQQKSSDVSLGSCHRGRSNDILVKYKLYPGLPKKSGSRDLVAVTEWFCSLEDFSSFSLRREVVGEGEMPFPNLPNTDQILGCCNFHITVAAMVYKCGYCIPCPIPSIERLPLSQRLHSNCVTFL